jgi:RNAse (barnase) inhibitor barstar
MEDIMNKKNKATKNFSEVEGFVNYPYDHVLTLTEYKSKSMDLVEQVMLETQVDAEKKEVNKNFSDKLNAIKQKIKELTEILNDNKERVEGKCVVKFNKDATRKFIIHPDTGDVIFEGATDLIEQGKARNAFNEKALIEIEPPNIWENELDNRFNNAEDNINFADTNETFEKDEAKKSADDEISVAADGQ